jgi:hypothetical protein
MAIKTSREIYSLILPTFSCSIATAYLANFLDNGLGISIVTAASGLVIDPLCNIAT